MTKVNEIIQYDCVICEMKFELPVGIPPYEHSWGITCFDCEEKADLDVDKLPEELPA